MKRLFKMLSLMSILLILGSCSTSKSIDVSTVLGTKKYVVFKTYLPSPDSVVYVEITGGIYAAKQLFTGNQLEITSGQKYTITWYWIESGALKSNSKTNYEFNSDYSTLLISVGTGIYKDIFIPTSLD